MSKNIIVYKCDHHSQPVYQYSGVVESRTEHSIVLEAYFNRDDRATHYHTFKRGDRFVEWFYDDRWYNIFRLHHRDSDALEGWYCNVTRPAEFRGDAIYADDLALDVMVYPDGRTLILDEDEFATLDIDAETRQAALKGLADLLTLVQEKEGPFSILSSL